MDPVFPIHPITMENLPCFVQAFSAEPSVLIDVDLRVVLLDGTNVPSWLQALAHQLDEQIGLACSEGRGLLKATLHGDNHSAGLLGAEVAFRYLPITA
jgi:hypothetical protein